MNVQKKMKIRKIDSIDEIILHHSGSDSDSPESIRRSHIQLGFADCGYHVIIKRDGSVVWMRDIEFVGAHCKGHNLRSIGICCLGDYSKKNLREEQYRSLNHLLPFIIINYDIKKVSAHSDYANTLCPGKDLVAIARLYSHVLDNCE